MKGRSHNELQRLLPPHSDRCGDLLISPDGECAHCVASLPKDRLLPSQLLKHLQ